MYQKRYKILELYLSNFKEKYYLRQISALSRLPLRTTQRLLNELEKEKIIKSKMEGKNKYYFLNLQNIKTKLYLIIAEINKTINFIEKYKHFKSFLKEKIDACLVVFGSFSTYKADINSDLDLLIIGNGDLPYYLLPYKIHQIKITKKQFEKFLSEGQALIKEILENHVILTNHSYFVNKLWEYYEKS